MNPSIKIVSNDIFYFKIVIIGGPIIGNITEVDGVLRLVEHGTQHATVGLILSTSVSLTNHICVNMIPSTSMIFHIVGYQFIVLGLSGLK